MSLDVFVVVEVVVVVVVVDRELFVCTQFAGRKLIKESNSMANVRTHSVEPIGRRPRESHAD